MEEIERIKKSLIVVRHMRRDGYEMIVTQRHLLKDVLKGKRKVFLPVCKFERCQKFKDGKGDFDCKRCIIEFYGVT